VSVTAAVDPNHATGRKLPESTVRRLAVVSAWTLVSKITGLLRVVVIGAVLGPTFFANAFVSTNLVPNLTYSAVAGPVLSLVIVPALVRAITTDGLGEAALVFRRVTGYVLFCAACVAGGLLVVAPGIAWLLTLGVPDVVGQERAWWLAMLLLAFVAPQVVLYALAALGTAAQQARGRFAAAAAAPALENVGLMVTLGIVAVGYGPGLEVGDVPLGMVVTLGIGATASVLLHAVVQVIGAARAGLRLRPAWWGADPMARDIAARMRSSLAVAIGPALSMFAVLALSATVAGGVLVLQIAYALYALPLALGVRAIIAAVLPGMAAAATGDDGGEGFARLWRQALTYAIFVGLPALCLMVGFAEPIATLLAQGELRDGPLVRALTACVVLFGVCQLARGVNEIGRQALFARLDHRGPSRVSKAALLTTLVLGLAALLVPAGPARLAALAFAVLAAEVVAAGLQLRGVSRVVSPHRLVDWTGVGIGLLGAVLMVPLILLGSLVAGLDVGPVTRLGSLPVAALLATVTFACVVALLHERTDTEQPADDDAARVRRPPHMVPAGLLITAVVAVLLLAGLGALNPFAGLLIIGALAVGALLALCAWRPIVATYLYIGTVLVLAGVERGRLVPLARLNEALFVVLVVGALIGLYLRWVAGGRPQLRLHPLDGPIAAFVLACTLWPLASMMLRGTAPVAGDVLAVLPVVKLVALMVLVRMTVHTERQLIRLVRLMVWSAAVIAVIAVLQTLRFGPVLTLLDTFWASPGRDITSERGTTTLASSIATGDVIVIALVVVVACAMGGWLGRRERIILGTTLGAGTLAAGQFSTWLAAAFVAALILARYPYLRRRAVRFVPLAAVAVLVGLPAFLGRLEGVEEFGVPRSWLGRWDNLSNFYVPRLEENFAFLIGVSPDSVLPAPETWRTEIFLESGYLQFIWVGGLPLLAVFGWLSWRLLHQMTTISTRPGVVGACAMAAWCTWWMVVVLSVIDPHLFLRGTGDFLFALIGAATGTLAAERSTAARMTEVGR